MLLLYSTLFRLMYYFITLIVLQFRFNVFCCILYFIPFLYNFSAHFEMNITIRLIKEDANKTTTIKIPKTAKVDNKSSNCGNITKNEDQTIVLNWKDHHLNRELVINFRRNLTQYAEKTLK